MDQSGRCGRPRWAAPAGRGSMMALRESEAASSRRHGAVLVVMAAVLWSGGGLLARLTGTGPWTTVFWRGVFSGFFMLAVLAIRHRARLAAMFRAIGLPGLAMASCFALASTAFILALSRTSVANVLIVQSTGPFMAGLLGWVIMRERVAAPTWLAMAAALAGTVLMVSGSWASGTVSGDLLAFFVASVFALGAVILRRHRDVPMLPAACLASMIAAGIAWPQATPSEAGPRDLALLMLFGAGQLGLGLILYTAGAPRIPVAQASLISVLESVLGPVWVWLALGEYPGARSLVGGAVVLSALLVHTVADLRRPGSAEAEAPAPSGQRSSPTAP
jgi:drug/metabolite transporter (DMT)-like permease